MFQATFQLQQQLNFKSNWCYDDDDKDDIKTTMRTNRKFMRLLCFLLHSHFKIENRFISLLSWLLFVKKLRHQWWQLNAINSQLSLTTLNLCVEWYKNIQKYTKDKEERMRRKMCWSHLKIDCRLSFFVVHICDVIAQAWIFQSGRLVDLRDGVKKILNHLHVQKSDRKRVKKCFLRWNYAVWTYAKEE